MEKKDNKSTILIVILSIILIALLVGTCMVTWMYKNGERNSVIIYYKGEYANPIIQFRLDKEEWDETKFEPNTEKKGYTHKVVIPLGNSTGMVGKFKDEEGNVEDNSGRLYDFTKGVYLYNDGALVRLDEVGDFNIVEFKVSPNAKSTSTGTTVSLQVGTMGGVKPITYKFVAKDAAGTETVIQDFADNNIAQWVPEEAGNYMLTAIARDKNGNESTESIEGFSVIALKVNSILTKVQSPQKIGTTIPLSMEIENPAKLDITCYYEISDGTETNKIEATTMGAADWVPEKAGNYTITGYAECEDKKASNSIQYVIDDNAEQNEVTVYYHSNESCDIFYAQVSEDVTSYDTLEMIGVNMEPDTSKDGYEYRFTTTIDSGNKMVVYFLNTQNGEIDNNNDQNYIIKAGVYGVKDNQLYNLEANDSDYGNNDDNNDDNDDENGDFQWQDYNANGNNSNNNLSGVSEGNSIRIYYKDKDYKYIHYQIGNGSWTKEPGDKMKSTFHRFYRRVIEIKLNGASYINACFNDGDGHWDNNNGNNYHLTAGTYYISNGKIDEYRAP